MKNIRARTLFAVRSALPSLLFATLGPLTLLAWYYFVGFLSVPAGSVENILLHISVGVIFSFGAVGVLREFLAYGGDELTEWHLIFIILLAGFGAFLWECAESVLWVCLPLKSALDVGWTLYGAVLGSALRVLLYTTITVRFSG